MFTRCCGHQTQSRTRRHLQPADAADEHHRRRMRRRSRASVQERPANAAPAAPPRWSACPRHAPRARGRAATPAAARAMRCRSRSGRWRPRPAMSARARASRAAACVTGSASGRHVLRRMARQAARAAPRGAPPPRRVARAIPEILVVHRIHQRVLVAAVPSSACRSSFMPRHRLTRTESGVSPVRLAISGPVMPSISRRTSVSR